MESENGKKEKVIKKKNILTVIFDQSNLKKMILIYRINLFQIGSKLILNYDLFN